MGRGGRGAGKRSRKGHDHKVGRGRRGAGLQESISKPLRPLDHATSRPGDTVRGRETERPLPVGPNPHQKRHTRLNARPVAERARPRREVLWERR